MSCAGYHIQSEYERELGDTEHQPDSTEIKPDPAGKVFVYDDAGVWLSHLERRMAYRRRAELIVDILIYLFILASIPVFDLIGAPPLFWVLTVLPCGLALWKWKHYLLGW